MSRSCRWARTARRRPLRVGAGATEGYGDYWFNGSVDEVAVYRRLTAARWRRITGRHDQRGALAAQVLALKPGLYLRLDDTQPIQRAANLGSLGDRGQRQISCRARSLPAADLISPTFPGFGAANPGLVFDGTGTSMAIGYTNIPVPWTMSCWVNRQDAPGASAVLMYSPSAGIKLEQWGSRQPQCGFHGLWGR